MSNLQHFWGVRIVSIRKVELYIVYLLIIMYAYKSYRGKGTTIKNTSMSKLKHAYSDYLLNLYLPATDLVELIQFNFGNF